MSKPVGPLPPAQGATAAAVAAPTTSSSSPFAPPPKRPTLAHSIPADHSAAIQPASRAQVQPSLPPLSGYNYTGAPQQNPSQILKMNSLIHTFFPDETRQFMTIQASDVWKQRCKMERTVLERAYNPAAHEKNLQAYLSPQEVVSREYNHYEPFFPTGRKELPHMAPRHVELTRKFSERMNNMSYRAPQKPAELVHPNFRYHRAGISQRGDEGVQHSARHMSEVTRWKENLLLSHTRV